MICSLISLDTLALIILLLHKIVFFLLPAGGADIPYPERCWDAPFSSPGTPAPPWDAAAALLRRPISPLRILAYRQPSKCKNESYYFAFIIPIFFSLSTTTKGLCSKSCLEADFLKLCDAVTVKPLVTRYTTHKSTAAEYICGCVLCSVAHCCVDWIWRDNISPDLTWVILSAITLAVCLADMSASPLRSYPT